MCSTRCRHDCTRLRRRCNCVDKRSSIPFGTLKAWMGATHFLTKTLPRVSTEMSLHVLAYNLKRVLQIKGAGALIAAMGV